MEFLPTVIAALVILIIVFFAVRSIVKKRKQGDCGCGCEHCKGCGFTPTEDK